MRWRIGVSALVLLAAGCGKSPSQYTQKADRLVEQHKYDDASIYYRKAIQKDPRFADAYYGIGKLFLARGKAREAYAALNRAMELAPQNLDARQKLANLVLGAYLSDRRHPQNLYDQLNKLAGDFLARDPNSYDGFRLKGYIALSDNHHDQALDDFRKALQRKPLDPEVTVTLAGVLLQDAATAPEGEKMVLDLIQKRKDTSAAYDLLYRYYMSARRPAEAESILKSKVSANPKQAAYILELAGAYRRAGKTAEMKSTLATLLDDPKTFSNGRMLVGDFYNQTGDRAQALPYYQQGAAMSAGNDQLACQKRIAATLVALGRSDQAMAQLQESLKAHPKDTDLRLARSLLWIDQRKLDSAIPELQALENEQKDNAVVKFQLGRALLLNGNAKDALGKWQEAIKLAPAYLDPKLALASYDLDQRNFAEAERLTNEIVSAAPGNLRAHILRADVLQGEGRPAEAEAELTDLRKQVPGNPDVENEYGLLLLRQNKPAEAEKVFRSMYQPGDTNLRPLTGLVNTLLAQKHGDEAVHLLQSDLAKAPGRTQVQFMLANTLALTGHRDSALQSLQQLVTSHPDNVQAQLTLGQLQAQAGNLEPAMATFQKARTLAPQSPQPLLLLAETADRLGHADAARQSYQAALKIDPSNLLALNNLAYLDAESGANLDEALRLITTASQKLPQQPNLADTLGYVYLKQKKLASALQVFDDLTRRYPTNPTFLFHRGLVLLESGSKEQAKRDLQSALAAKPPADLAVKIREALERAT